MNILQRKIMTDFPILYSFRRCPYAMRARLAVAASGLTVELREIVLRDKAPEFLAVSPSATVPCLVDLDGSVVDESLDVMLWALRRSDPEGWLTPEVGDLDEMLSLIGENDGPFKRHLDRYKYDSRYEGADKHEEREGASRFLRKLDERLAQSPWLFGNRASLADYAILPFVRQFANSGRDWFDAEPWETLRKWLERFETSDKFTAMMGKYERWNVGNPPVFYGGNAA